MIPTDNVKQSMPIQWFVLHNEIGGRGVGMLGEKASIMRAIQRIRGLPGEQVIPVVTPIQIEVHIKPRLVRQFGLAPFRHQDRIRIHCAHSADHILPHGDGRLLVLRVELYERIRHIHPEPVASQFEPMLHDLHHGLPGGHGSRCVW